MFNLNLFDILAYFLGKMDSQQPTVVLNVTPEGPFCVGKKYFSKNNALALFYVIIFPKINIDLGEVFKKTLGDE